jgi:hypothetical protein
MFQDENEVIDYKKVMLEEETRQIQKPKDSKRNEILIVLPSEHSLDSEVEVINTQYSLLSR